MDGKQHSWSKAPLRRFLSVFLALVLLLSTGLSSIAAAMEADYAEEEAPAESFVPEEPAEDSAEEPEAGTQLEFSAEQGEVPEEENPEVDTGVTEETSAAETSPDPDAVTEEEQQKNGRTPAETADEPAEDQKAEESPAGGPETAVSMPPMSFFETAGSVNVSAWADKDTFPEGTEMAVKPVMAENVITAVQNAMQDDTIQADDVTAVTEYHSETLNQSSDALRQRPADL